MCSTLLRPLTLISLSCMEPFATIFFKGVEILVLAEALTAIGAAFAKRMIPLRTMCILNNMFGVAAGIGSGSLSTFIEHAVNLPLNAVRLREMRRLIKSVREASANDLKIEWLKPFMHPRALKAGSRVFSKGDEAKEAFVLVEGRIVIPESSAAIEPGAIFGEMALLRPPDGERLPPCAPATLGCSSSLMNSSSSCISKTRIRPLSRSSHRAPLRDESCGASVSATG